MAKKLKGLRDKKGAAGTDYTRQVWLAGLGAFSIAQEEGGKLFDTLVEHGKEVESESKKAAEDSAQAVATSVKSRASEALDKLEQVFQDRVARALNRLGVPTKDDVQELSRRVETLNKNIQGLLQEARQEADTAA